MKTPLQRIHHFLAFTTLFLISACGSPTSTAQSDEVIQVPSFEIELESNAQVAEYVRNIIQDRNGDLWFGTNNYGVAHFDGERLQYYSNEQGFGGGQITGITEDRNGSLWFATNQGVVRHDLSTSKGGTAKFTNYTEPATFKGGYFRSIYADSKGFIWAGTGKRVFQFNGAFWSPFELPYPSDYTGDNLLTGNPVWGISEDSEGNIWFATAGNGAIQYTGKSFVQYTREDGLLDDNVDNVLHTSDGSIWMGTRFGGISHFDGKTFTNYSDKDSIWNNEVCVSYQTSDGDIWFSSEGFGVYRFDGKSFTNYTEAQGLGVKAVQTIFEDKQGRIWAGGGGGLYRFEKDRFVEVRKNGPWE
ncbi:MAG: two-component regulator propeller domain-containing protein [Saprospiraceae bacterium]